MEERLAFLCGTWLFDTWKVFIHGRNIVKTLSRRPPAPEMILLNTDVDGVIYFHQVQRLVAFINAVDILLILGTSVGRVIRVSQNLCAKRWALEKQKNYEIKVPYLHNLNYMIWEITTHKLTFSVLSWQLAWTMRGLLLHRRDAIMWDIVEWVLLDIWCVCILGLSYGETVEPYVWIIAAVTITLGGCLFSVGWSAYEDIAPCSEIGNNSASLEYKAMAKQFGFLPENLLRTEKDSFDVKYYNLLMMDWACKLVLRTDLDGFLVIDDKVTGYSNEIVNILIASELGQWYYRVRWYNYAIPFLRMVTLGVFLMMTYDNKTVSRWFSFPKDDPPEPISPMMVAYQWIWPYASDIFNFVHSLCKCRSVYASDEFACWYGRPTDLINALNTVAGSSENYPVFDSWYSAWILGCPTIQNRVANVRKIEKRISSQKPFSWISSIFHR